MGDKKIFVDQGKCRKDDLCVKICPGGLISRAHPDGFPEMRQFDDGMCMGCGHCVAVCPHGALTHSDVRSDKCPPVKKELSINMEQTIQFLRSRRSIRFFKDKSVEKDKIESLIQIARYAPSGGNTQSVQWTVIHDRSTIKKVASLSIEVIRNHIADNPDGVWASTAYIPEIVRNWDMGKDEILWDAPVLILASAPFQMESGKEDLMLALSYLDLAALSMGLGTCWTGSFTGTIEFSDSLKNELGLTRDHTSYYSMVLGYPKFRYKRLIQRKEPEIIWK